MAQNYQYDVFLSHSSQDKDTVRDIAERLRRDGLRVWFDEWTIGPVEDGLEHSQILILCMSAHAFSAEWPQLESHTFRFRDPLNRERRFIPLRLDTAEIKGSLAQFMYIDWLPAKRDAAYAKLLEACQSTVNPSLDKPQAAAKKAAKVIELDSKINYVYCYAFAPDANRVLICGNGKCVELFDLQDGQRICELKGHTDNIQSIAWSKDQKFVLSGATDQTLRLWELETGRCIRVFKGHVNKVNTVVWSTDQRRALSGAGSLFSITGEGALRLWDIQTGECLRTFKGHTDRIHSVAWSKDNRFALSGSEDKTVRLWDVETGDCLHVLKGHTDHVLSVVWSADQRRALSGSHDNTVRLWDLETGRCLHILEGHTDPVLSVAWSDCQRFALSGGWDGTARLWDLETRRCLSVLEGTMDVVQDVTWSVDGRRAFCGSHDHFIHIWDLSEFVTEGQTLKTDTPIVPPPQDQIQYTNAKVLLIGESSAGKTGLSNYLAHNIKVQDAKPLPSTVGAWASQWPILDHSGNNVAREIWLWDFGGQADQRLIHQLYMEDAAMAVLVFDGQKDDLFETLSRWDRDLSHPLGQGCAKLLVAGRVDAGGLRCSREHLEAFATENGYPPFLATSAKTGEGCPELKQAILDGIRWGNIPWRTSPRVFKRLKEEIIRLKDEGRALIRFNTDFHSDKHGTL